MAPQPKAELSAKNIELPGPRYDQADPNVESLRRQHLNPLDVDENEQSIHPKSKGLSAEDEALAQAKKEYLNQIQSVESDDRFTAMMAKGAAEKQKFEAQARDR